MRIIDWSSDVCSSDLPAPPLKQLGNDPVSEKPVVVKDGRFGPYVTDGETNASLRKGDTIENVTIERAAELLQIRRDAGPAKKGGRKKADRKSTRLNSSH